MTAHAYTHTCKYIHTYKETGEMAHLVHRWLCKYKDLKWKIMHANPKLGGMGRQNNPLCSPACQFSWFHGIQVQWQTLFQKNNVESDWGTYSIVTSGCHMHSRTANARSNVECTVKINSVNVKGGIKITKHLKNNKRQNIAKQNLLNRRGNAWDQKWRIKMN